MTVPADLTLAAYRLATTLSVKRSICSASATDSGPCSQAATHPALKRQVKRAST